MTSNSVRWRWIVLGNILQHLECQVVVSVCFRHVPTLHKSSFVGEKLHRQVTWCELLSLHHPTCNWGSNPKCSCGWRTHGLVLLVLSKVHSLSLTFLTQKSMDVAVQTPKKRQHGSCFINMIYSVCFCCFCSWILALKPHDFSSNVACNGTSPAMWGTSGSDSLACSKLQGTRAASQDGKKWLVVEAWDFPVGGNLWFFGRVHYYPSYPSIKTDPGIDEGYSPLPWAMERSLDVGVADGAQSSWGYIYIYILVCILYMYYVLWLFPESIMILWVMLRNGSVAWVLYGIWTAIAENIV